MVDATHPVIDKNPRMNPVSIVSIAASLVSLVLSLVLFFTNTSAQSLQNDLQKKQQELQDQQQEVQLQQQTAQAQRDQIQSATQLAKQVGPKVLEDIGNLVVQNKNENLRKLLAKHKITISESSPAPKAGASPAAAPKAAAAPAATPHP